MSTQVVQDLKNALGDELERLSTELMSRLHAAQESSHDAPAADRTTLQERIRFLGALLAALPGVDSAHVLRGRVGLGSTVRVRDLMSERTESFAIVPSELADGTPTLVTPGSPVGQAVLGGRKGDVVEVTTPARVRKIRVERVQTVWDTLEAWRRGDVSAVV